MNQYDIQKDVKKALEEERRQQAWKRSLDHDFQRYKKSSSEAEKALLTAFVAPPAILGAAMAQNDRKRKSQQKTPKRGHSFVWKLVKIYLFLFIVYTVLTALKQI